jgi:hypothetical protein
MSAAGQQRSSRYQSFCYQDMKMKHKLSKSYRLSLRLLVLSLILSASFGASTTLAACGSSTHVATESELNAAIADFNSQS